MSNQVIAATILEQLGGQRFRVMTGAKNFMASEKALSFKLPGAGGFCRDGINFVTITLAPSDTYTVEFFRVRGSKIKQILRYCDVYNDGLREVFERATGLATSMGTMRVAS